MSIFRKTRDAEQKSRPTIIVIESPPAGVVLHGKYVSHQELYATSPSVRACVDWIARNVARYHVETHMIDGDGERPIDKDRVRALFNDPAPGISRFQLLEHLMIGTLLSGNAYAPLIVGSDGRVTGIVPTGATVSLKREQGGPPEKYLLQTGLAEAEKVDPENMLHVRATTTTDPWVGLSPLAPLQGLLAEERAATAARQRFWINGLHKEGVIEQDVGVRSMSDEARESYIIDIQAALAPTENETRPLLLEPGQHWKESAFTPAEAEFSEARSLTLRLVAGVLAVPPQIIGAEGRNTRTAYREVEQALAPWVDRIESAINAQLVPRLYGEQAAGGRIRARLLVPAPVTDQELGQTLDGAVKSGRLTPDEARAVTGLPPVPGGDRLAPQAPGGGIPA